MALKGGGGGLKAVEVDEVVAMVRRGSLVEQESLDALRLWALSEPG